MNIRIIDSRQIVIHLEIFRNIRPTGKGGYRFDTISKGKNYRPAWTPSAVCTHRLLKSLATRLNRVIRLHWATLVSSFNYNLDGDPRDLYMPSLRQARISMQIRCIEFHSFDSCNNRIDSLWRAEVVASTRRTHRCSLSLSLSLNHRLFLISELFSRSKAATK